MILEIIRKKIKKNVLEILDEIKREMVHKMNVEMAIIKRRIVKEMISLTVLWTAVIFILISAVYFLTEYLVLTKTIAFLIIGVFLLIIGIIIRAIK